MLGKLIWAIVVISVIWNIWVPEDISSALERKFINWIEEDPPVAEQPIVNIVAEVEVEEVEVEVEESIDVYSDFSDSYGSFESDR